MIYLFFYWIGILAPEFCELTDVGHEDHFFIFSVRSNTDFNHLFAYRTHDLPVMNIRNRDTKP